MKNKISETQIHHGLTVFFVAAMLIIMAALPAFATTSIRNVKFTVTDDIKPGSRYGTEEIDVDVETAHCNFDYYEINNDGIEWALDQIPEIIIYISPDDGYSLPNKSSSITIEGATYVKGVKSDGQLALTVQLTPMNERVADIEDATLTDSGYVYWDAPYGAGSYDLRIYRNGSLASTTDVHVEATEYNLKDYMDRAGSYYVRVRACNLVNPSTKSDWYDTETVTISAERAGEIKEGLTLDRPMKGEWVSTENGWQYPYEDGSLATGWLYLDNHWFYFDENGYMMTGWIEVDGKEYYMNDITGQMLTNTTTPDGYKVDENGNKKNGR